MSLIFKLEELGTKTYPVKPVERSRYFVEVVDIVADPKIVALIGDEDAVVVELGGVVLLETYEFDTDFGGVFQLAEYDPPVLKPLLVLVETNT